MLNLPESPYYEYMDELMEDLGEAVAQAHALEFDLRWMFDSKSLDEPYKLDHHRIPQAPLKRLLTLLHEAKRLKDDVTDWDRLWSRSPPAQ